MGCSKYSLTDSQTIRKRSRGRWIWRCCASLALLLEIAVAASLSFADELSPTPETAVATGEIPSFYVRAVTGPLAGKSVCYVCRNGERPAVIVLLREIGPDVTLLLKELDRKVNRHRAEGLRCFAVLLTDTPQRDAARLQTLAFDEKIELPLTLLGESATQGSTLAFSREATVSVVTCQDRRIVERFSFKTGACDENARRSVIAAAEKLVAGKD